MSVIVIDGAIVNRVVAILGQTVFNALVPNPTGEADGQLIETTGADEYALTLSPSVERLRFSTTNAQNLDAAGDIAWDDVDQALAYRTNGLTLDIAQENVVYVRNPAGNTTLLKGTAVCIAGAASNRIQVTRTDASVGASACRSLGIVMADIPSPGFGFVSTFGLLRGFNTNNVVSNPSFPLIEGAEVFASTTPGVLTTIPATSPNRRVTYGYIVTTGNNGSIFVTIRRGFRVDELDDVLITNPQAGDVLVFDGTKWINQQP
jgi:hypothetical protein